MTTKWGAAINSWSQSAWSKKAYTNYNGIASGNHGLVSGKQANKTKVFIPKGYKLKYVVK